MANYTTLKLTVSIKRSAERFMDHLTSWLKNTPGYNPDLTHDHDDKNFAVFGGDSHLFFSNPDAYHLIGLQSADTRDDPVWNFNKDDGTLTIDTYFKNYHGAVDMFLDWLSAFVDQVIDSEYNYEGDLEGPRHINFEAGRLTVEQWSFTR